MKLPPLDLNELLTPLDKRQAAGCFDAEDDTFQGIEHEMVKLGGLQEATIDWSYVDEASRQYLQTQCKHFRVAGHLMTSRLQAHTWPHWSEAANILAGMVERYWENGYPKPGPTGLLMKRKLVVILVERMVKALPSLEKATYAPEFQSIAQRAFDSLQAQAATAQLDVPKLSRLEAKMQRTVEETRLAEPIVVPSSGIQSGDQNVGDQILGDQTFSDQTRGSSALGDQISGAALHNGPSPSVPPDNGLSNNSPLSNSPPLSETFFQSADTMPRGDERETRRSLLSIAEFINQQDAYDPTGYQLRRFALWAHLRAAPPAKQDQLTELICVPVDIEETYRKALATNNVNPALLQRVEKSATNSPYWFRGSFLAASIASRLEMPEVAEAIRHATGRFLLRLPALSQLRFADGRAFADRETLGWVGDVDAERSAVDATAECADLRDELAAQLDSQGVEPVLRRLQEYQTSEIGPRERCHATVIAADLLKSRGLSWLADELYTNAIRMMNDMTVDRWEPTLYQHVAQEVDMPARENLDQHGKQGVKK